MHAAVASRLRREELEESGKFRRELAEQARERDFTRSAVMAVGREGKKGRTTEPSVELSVSDRIGLQCAVFSLTPGLG